MTIGIRMKFAGMSQEDFDKVNEQVDLVSDPPRGLLFHSSGPIDGGWGVIDFWDSREDFDTFWETRIKSSVEKAGVQLQGPPDIKEFPVHETFAG
jgi:hypothetical protein